MHLTYNHIPERDIFNRKHISTDAALSYIEQPHLAVLCAMFSNIQFTLADPAVQPSSISLALMKTHMLQMSTLQSSAYKAGSPSL
jgi:hypothetical protein